MRRGLTLLEIAADLAREGRIDAATLAQVLADRSRRFDKGGEQFYDQISALHKSVRSSDPDAALYWFTRMLDGGCDPHYLARRLVRMAIEDVGLADPRALALAVDAWAAWDRLGSPEGDLALAEVAIYLALAPRSNAAYVAFGAARGDVREHGTQPVPMALRNAPTRLMKELGYGQGYQYDHDLEGGVALAQQCLPEILRDRSYYQPAEQGLEIRLREKLAALRLARSAARNAGAGAARRRPRRMSASNWPHFLAVGCGGAAGAMLRHAVNQLFIARGWYGIPAATLLVNVAGCLLGGLVLAWLDTKGPSAPLVAQPVADRLPRRTDDVFRLGHRAVAVPARRLASTSRCGARRPMSAWACWPLPAATRRGARSGRACRPDLAPPGCHPATTRLALRAVWGEEVGHARV